MNPDAQCQGAAPATRPTRKRGHRGGRRRGKIATLEGRLWRAVDDLHAAERDRRRNDAEMLRRSIFGVTSAPGGLWAELRAARHHRDDELRRTLAKRLGCSLSALAAIESQRTRLAPPTPDLELGRGVLR